MKTLYVNRYTGKWFMVDTGIYGFKARVTKGNGNEKPLDSYDIKNVINVTKYNELEELFNTYEYCEGNMKYTEE